MICPKLLRYSLVFTALLLTKPTFCDDQAIHVTSLQLNQSGSASKVKLGDLDGDVDIFVGQDGGESKLWLNDGLGNFSSVFGLGTGIHSVAVGDVDEDGDLDIFAVGCAPPTVWINQHVKPEIVTKQ